MDVQKNTKVLDSVRMPLLVREILLAMIQEVDDYARELYDVTGLNQRDFEYLSAASSASLLVLATSLAKSGAIDVELDHDAVARLMCKDQGQPFSTRQHCELAFIFNHQHVVRPLIMLLADALHQIGFSATHLKPFPDDIKRYIARATGQQLTELAQNVVEEKCLRFTFNRKILTQRVFSHLRFERTEAIKDLLVSKKATYGLMLYLFSEENEDTVKARRNKLGVEPLRGRPRTTSLDQYVNFICFWEDYADEKSKLERFLSAHRQFGFGFDVLWALYQKARNEGEFDLVSS